MKFLLIFLPMALYGGFISFQPGNADSENLTSTEKSDRELIVQQQESVFNQDLEMLTNEPLAVTDLEGPDENIILSEVISDEPLSDQDFDFPEREFPDAPDYYRSANAPE